MCIMRRNRQRRFLKMCECKCVRVPLIVLNGRSITEEEYVIINIKRPCGSTHTHIRTIMLCD